MRSVYLYLRIMGLTNQIDANLVDLDFVKMKKTDIEIRIKELELELGDLKSGVIATKQSSSRTSKSTFEENENKFLSLANNIPAYIAYVNAGTIRYEFVNELYEKSFGIPREKIIGSHLKDIIGEENYKIASSYIEEVKSGKSCSYENTFNLASGKQWIKVNYSPVFDGSSKVVGIALVSYDISERKKTEEEIIQKNKTLAIILEISHAVSASLDISIVNQMIIEKATSLLGLDSGAIYEVNGENLSLKATTPPLPPGFPDELRHARLINHPHIQKTISTRSHIVLEDTATAVLSPEERAAVEQRSLRSIIYIPLIHGKEVLGVMILSTQKKLRSFSEDEITLYYTFSSYVTTSLKNAILHRDVQNELSKRKKAEIELIAAKEKAEESDLLKSAFLANMSHEIRTPMNGILGFAELLKKPSLTDEKQQEFIKIISESGNRMLDTINNIVDISKIEVGLMSIYMSMSNVNLQIEFLHEFFKPMADSKGLQLSYNSGLPSNEANINTDKGKFTSILTNLVNNAIKFTIEGSIEFGYITKGAYLEFFVKDTGIGIPKDSLEAIFELFVQADIEAKRALQGSGLGLTISKSYVEMLGGKMWVESTEGKGSIFYFTIPYNTVLEEIDTIKNGVPDEDKEGQIIPKVSGLKVLIAEDDEVSDLLITKALQEISYEIIHASTGVEAIEFCRSNPDLDLILMDIRMPEMDGYEATRQIRLFNTAVIIIAQTAYAFAGDRELALEAGCNDYISKPMNMTLLNDLVKKYCH